MFTYERKFGGGLINNYLESDQPFTKNSCFDLQQYVETKLKAKYNLTSTTIYFEVINLNESLTLDLEEIDIKNIFSKFGPVKLVEIFDNVVSVTFVHYFSVIFSYETISELIDPEKKVYLKPRLTKEAASVPKEYTPFDNQSFPFFQQPTLPPCYNNNGFFFTPYSLYNPSFETPKNHNNFCHNNYFPPANEQIFDEKNRTKLNNNCKTTMNYSGNSNIFSKKQLENDMKFQTDVYSQNLSVTNCHSNLLSMNSPMFFPQNFYSPTSNFEFLNSEQTYEEENLKFIGIYDVQIENDDKFKVTKRVIGIKGNNMKKILNTCKMRFNYINSSELIKIRLRGKGSGYKEGQTNKESEEALQLCVSSKYNDVFLFTCGCIENLLNKIYLDYHTFQLSNKNESKGPKEIKKQVFKINKNNF